jgi:hypothetical protein
MVVCTLESINLKELEKKAYRSMFQDGLWDLFLAIMFLGGAVNPIIRDMIGPVSSAITPIFAFLVFYFGKKFITIPRLGHVKFGPKRQKAQKRLRIAIVFFVVITWAALLLVLTRTVALRPNNEFIWVIAIEILFITIPLSVIAYFLDFDRLYAYAVLYGISYPIAEFLHPYVGTPLDGIIVYGISGGIGLVVGLLYLIRFVRMYPKIEPSEYHNLELEG